MHNITNFNFKRWAAKEKEKHTGVMIAFILPGEIARKIVPSKKELPDGCEPEPTSELHITVAYLGKSTDNSLDKDKVLKCIEDFANSNGIIEGKISGVGRFNAAEGQPHPFYASFDAPELPDFRHNLLESLSYHGTKISKQHGYTPHITLSYLKPDSVMPNIQVPTLEVKFDKICVSWGGERHMFKLKNSDAKED